MRVVLDAGGVSALVADRAAVRALAAEIDGLPLVPVAVLCDVLTGDPRRDHGVDRFLRRCQLVPVDEALARAAARLRNRTGRAGSISAVDALVAAVAVGVPGCTVVTSDPNDLRALLSYADVLVKVARV